MDAPPVVSKADANSDFILILAVQSHTKSLMELSDYADNVLQQQLQTIDQVSSVNVFGDKSYAMRIWLNQDKMNAYGIAYNDLSTAMANENVQLPPGKIYGNNTELTIKTLGRLTSEKAFPNLILSKDPSTPLPATYLPRVEL